MQKLRYKYLKFFSVCGAFVLANLTLASDEIHQKYLESIERMVVSGVLSEQEGKEQIGQLQMSEDHSEQAKINIQTRGIASTLSEKKIIEFSNEPIEIQVK